MSLPKRYSKAIRSHLSYFPVWSPGNAISVGDVGEIKSGIFHKQTFINELFPNIQLDIEEDTTKDQFQFAMETTVSVKVGAEAGEALTQATGSEASAEIQFGKNGGVVFHAHGCTGKFLNNLLKIRDELKANRKMWPKGNILVTHIEDAEKYTVMLADGGGAAFKISGKANAVKSLKIADLSINISGSKNITFHKSGSGPILFLAYGFGLFGRKPKLLSYEDSDEVPADFYLVSPRDPQWDKD